MFKGFENTMQKAPDSIYPKGEHENSYEAVVHLGPSAIVRTEVNTFLQNDIPQETLRKFIENNCVLTGVLGTSIETADDPKLDSIHLRASSKSIGRGTPVAYGYLHSGFLRGTVITEKGGGMTGNYLTTHYDIEDSFEDRFTPHGLYGEISAKEEMRLSNLLASHGYRVSMPLGYSELNAEEVLDTLQNYQARMFMEKQFDKIASNGDKAVEMFRVDATLERYAVVYDDEFSAKRFRAEFSRAADFLVRESNELGSLMERYLDYLEHTEINKNHVLDMLEEVKKTRRISTEQNYEVYLRLLSVINGFNLKALVQVNQDAENTIFPFPRYSDGRVIGKDTDLAHFDKDMELNDEFAEREPNAEEIIEAFVDFKGWSIANLRDSLEKSGILDPQIAATVHERFDQADSIKQVYIDITG